MRKKIVKGFTLIELLVVIAIIGILSGTGVVAYNSYTSAAKESATKSEWRTPRAAFATAVLDDFPCKEGQNCTGRRETRLH